MNSRNSLLSFFALVFVIALFGCQNEPKKEAEVKAEITPDSLTIGNLYMDIHRNVADLTMEGLREAHQNDLATQDKCGVIYHRYWFNEEAGTVFCLVEAPDKETAAKVHEEAHGLVADELIRVDRGL